MEIGAIFLVLAVFLLVGLYVAQPFFGPRGRETEGETHKLSALMAERDRVVNALQELDFDFALHKIPAEDYPVQRAELLQKGAAVLKQLDALTPNSYPAPNGKAADKIESAIAARNDDEIEALIAARRKTRKVKSGGFCPRCGKPILASDRFCPHCGKSVS
jgi:NADH pyrophosphatase NudC (nudix superfamily)